MKMGLQTSLVVRGPPLPNARVTTEVLPRGLDDRCVGRLIRNVEEEWLGTVLFFEYFQGFSEMIDFLDSNETNPAKKKSAW